MYILYVVLLYLYRLLYIYMLSLNRYQHDETRRVIGAFINWQHGAMGYEGSKNRPPLFWRFWIKAFEDFIPSVHSSFACTTLARLQNGYAQ